MFMKEGITPIISLLRLERILIFFCSICQHSTFFCRLTANANLIHFATTILDVYSTYSLCGSTSEVRIRKGSSTPLQEILPTFVISYYTAKTNVCNYNPLFLVTSNKQHD